MRLKLPAYDYCVTIKPEGRSIEHGRTWIPDGYYMKLSDGPVPVEIKDLLVRGFSSLPRNLQQDFERKLYSRTNYTCYALDSIVNRLVNQ
jgi:hypothetical protein